MCSSAGFAHLLDVLADDFARLLDVLAFRVDSVGG